MSWFNLHRFANEINKSFIFIVVSHQQNDSSDQDLVNWQITHFDIITQIPYFKGLMSITHITKMAYRQWIKTQRQFSKNNKCSLYVCTVYFLSVYLFGASTTALTIWVLFIHTAIHNMWIVGFREEELFSSSVCVNECMPLQWALRSWMSTIH